MTDTTTAYEVRRRVYDLAAGDKAQETTLGMIAEAVLAYARQTASLVSKIAYVRDTLDRAEETIAKGYSVNSLGIIQGSGLDLDRACALRAAAAEQVATATYFAETIGVSAETIEALLAGTDFAAKGQS